MIAYRVLDAGVDLESDHPGFNDETYRARRGILATNAMKHRWDQPIPRIEYTQNEIDTWGQVWDRMEGLWKDYACKEYLHSLNLLKQTCGYGRDNIPQQQDISEFLQHRTNFTMRPVAGLLSSRDFLNGLAFRVFFSTQYIRHHSKPLYTPEPGKLFWRKLCGRCRLAPDHRAQHSIRNLCSFQNRYLSRALGSCTGTFLFRVSSFSHADANNFNYP